MHLHNAGRNTIAVLQLLVSKRFLKEWKNIKLHSNIHPWYLAYPKSDRTGNGSRHPSPHQHSPGHPGETHGISLMKIMLTLKQVPGLPLGLLVPVTHPNYESEEKSWSSLRKTSGDFLQCRTVLARLWAMSWMMKLSPGPFFGEAHLYFVLAPFFHKNIQRQFVHYYRWGPNQSVTSFHEKSIKACWLFIKALLLIKEGKFVDWWKWKRK